MPFLKSAVLLDKMEVVPSNYNCSLHLLASNDTIQDSTTNADIASERTFFVNVSTLTGLQ